jgi:hypothetical protein
MVVSRAAETSIATPNRASDGRVIHAKNCIYRVFRPKGPPLKKGSTHDVVQMQLVPQKSAAIPDSAFM